MCVAATCPIASRVRVDPAVHTDDGKQVDRVKEIYKTAGAQDISSTTETAVKKTTAHA